MSTTSRPIGTSVRVYEVALAAFGGVFSELRKLHDRTQAFPDPPERTGAPYTPGRMPVREGGK